MLVLIGVHALTALLAPGLVRTLGRRAFALLALAPAAAFAWILTRLPIVLAGGQVEESVTWIPALGVEIAVRLDALSATLSLLVTGVGALVVLYCARYFTPSSSGLGRFAGVLVAFAGAMLGLVWADDVAAALRLLGADDDLLVPAGRGRTRTSGPAARAAMQALLVTAAGGLAMLVGFVMLGGAGGHLPALGGRRRGPAAARRGGHGRPWCCVLVGALSKSALIPFNFWLPVAMAAPTPVSAYLHAAAMVKAGVYLVRASRPGSPTTAAWRPLIAVAGLADDAAGRLARAAPARPQAAARVRHRVSQLGLHARCSPGRAPRDGALAGARHAGGARAVQVGALPGRRHHRPLRRHPGPARALRPGAAGPPCSRSRARSPPPRWPGMPPLLGFVAKEARVRGVPARLLRRLGRHAARRSSCWGRC